METKTYIALAVLLASVTISRADIVGYSLADDGDGVITCTNYGLENVAPGVYQTYIYGDHNIWGPGHILGYFTTDTESDPTLTLGHSIDNDTGSDWGDYHVVVTMDKSFSFSAIGVGNAGWTFNSVAPSLVGTNYVGTINYYAVDPYLTPVLAGGTLNFNFSVSFSGSVSFAEQLTPSPVPEPATFVLVACGLGGLLIRRRLLAS